MAPSDERSASIEVIACVDTQASAATTALLESLRACNRSNLPVTVLSGPDRRADALEAIARSEVEAVLVVDERCRFLRPFDARDFFSSDGTPYVFLTEDHEFWVDAPPGVAQELISSLQVAASAIRVAPSVRRTNRGPVLFAVSVLREFKASVLTSRGWDWRDLLEQVDDAGVWYAAWLESQSMGGVEMREPIFLTVLTPGERADVVLRKQTLSDIARGFVGLVVEGAWPDDGGTGVSATDAARALAMRPYLRLPRVQRFVARLKR